MQMYTFEVWNTGMTLSSRPIEIVTTNPVGFAQMIDVSPRVLHWRVKPTKPADVEGLLPYSICTRMLP